MIAFLSFIINIRLKYIHHFKRSGKKNLSNKFRLPLLIKKTFMSNIDETYYKFFIKKILNKITLN